MLLLIVEMQQISEKKIAIAKEKLVPTKEDLNPNTKFVDNLVIKQLSENIRLNSYIEKNTITWSDQDDFLRVLYQKLIASDLYNNYMNSEKRSYQEDKKFVEKFFLQFLAKYDDFYTTLEEKSIYWNDESEFIISMIVKSLKGFQENDDENMALLSLFKDKEDETYVRELFQKTLANHSENIKMVEANTKNWELDRIAFMDVLIMEMALTELTDFSAIPINVTLNEYLEIAKHYSTEKSSKFINGILDKLVKELTENGAIKKRGKGLMSKK